MDKPWHLYVMAMLYILAGINHFRKPELYLKIIPSFFSFKKLVNEFSGLIEIVLGIYLCIPVFSNLAAISLIILLVALLPLNLFMLINQEASLGLPKWFLYSRIPLQFLLIFWAYQYTVFTQI